MIGSVERDPAGTLILDRLAIAGSAANLSGAARFDPASNRLAAAFALDLPRLKPLGAALGTEMAGAISARLTSEGTLDRLRLTSEIEGGDIAAGGAKIDRLRLAANIADLSERKATLDSSLRAYGLDGTLALAAELKENSELVIPRLRMTAAESVVEGSLRIALDTGLIRGSIT
jgi:autotransporter translocation and assembly factor TamB